MGSVARFDSVGAVAGGATPQMGRSRTPSQERFSPLHQPMASLPFPGPRRGPTALPSIPAIPRMVSSCPPEPYGTEDEEREGEQEAVDADGGSAVERRRCSSPCRAAAAVPFSLASTRRTGEGGNVWSSNPSTQDVSAVEEEPVTAVEYTAPTPPPPPWTPAEALYWMSSRLTRQEAREMLAYDQVYYCGPAVPPRTACGVTETSSAVSREKESLHYGEEDVVHAAGAPRPHPTSQNPAAASPSSYFPITLGMHIRFRYEVTEVLGFGTFSVVVRAIDHAAAPLSPERHCALKLIRKEMLYQQAAQDEWATYARVKACCGAPVDGEEGGDRDNPSNVDAVDASATSPHHRRHSSGSGPSLSLTRRLSTADQRTICGAAIVTPRTRFEFRGYHVMVLPLMGFSLRDVLELRRESDEAAVRGAGAGTVSGARPVLSDSEAATGFPRAVGTSVLAQVVHALAFLHRTAHLLHGDLKPENVVFVDRMVSQRPTEASPTMPFSDQQRVSFLRSSDGALAPFFAAAQAGATTSTSLNPLFRCSSAGHQYRLFSLPPHANTTDAAAASAATPPAPEEEAGVPLRAPTLRTASAASVVTPKAALSSAVQWVRSCASGDASKSSGSVEGEHSGGTVQANLSVNHVPHTPSRRTPGLTSSRTGTLAPPHHGRLTDALTLEDSGEESAVASASRIATATATPVSAVPPVFAVEGSRRGSDTAATHHHSTSRLSRRNTVASTSSDLALFSSAAQTSTRIAVIDLGHAKPLAPWQTGTAFPLQSPSYRAPEMALRLPYTTAIDMWSLGCVLYELGTGHVLFPAAGDDATMLSAAVEVLGMPDTTFLAMVKMCWKEYKLRKASGSTPTGDDVDALPLNSLSAYVTEGDGGVEAATTTAAAGPVSGLSAEEAAMERCWKSFIQVLNASAGQQRARAERRRRQSTSIYISGNASGNTEPGKAKDGDAAPAVVRVTPWETSAQCALLSELFPDGEVSVAEQTFSLTTSAASPLTEGPPNLDGEPSAPQRLEYLRADFLLGCLYWDATERLSAVEAQYHPYVADLFTAETAATLAEASGQQQQQQQQQPLPHCSGVFYLQHHPLTTRLFPRNQSTNGGRRSSEDRDRERLSRDSLPPSRGTSLSTLPLRPLAPSAILPFDLPSSKRAAPSAKAWEEHQQQRHHQEAAATDGAGESGGWCTPRGQSLSVFCGHALSPSVEEAGPHATTAAAAALLHLGLHRRNERTPIHDVDLVSPDRHAAEYEAGMDEDEEGECSARQDGHEVMVLRLD